MKPNELSLVERCRHEALRLLHENSTPSGILAAAPGAEATARGYDRIFARDTAICALGILCTGDEALIEAALSGLRTVGAHQAVTGQLPKYVDARTGKADFWYLGCIDATLWWLVARDFAASRSAAGAAFAETTGEQSRRAVEWLRTQEHPHVGLVQQNEASDWADIMPRSGFVLYSNALWYRVKRRYRVDDLQTTRLHFNQVFFPFGGDRAEYRRLRLLQHYARRIAHHRDLYLSFVNLASAGDEGDIFGNLLALLFGLADDRRAAHILAGVDAAHRQSPYPARAVRTPIRRGSPLWRPYMTRHRQNYEWQYHNGGIWPFIGGFWIAALAAHGRRDEARMRLARLAQANAVDGWAFWEWFHGQNGAPGGMRRQSWNAAMFLLACHAIEHPIF